MKKFLKIMNKSLYLNIRIILEKIFLFTCFIFLLTEIINAPLRYFNPFLPYINKILMIISISCLLLYKIFIKFKIKIIIIMFLFIFFYGLIIGLFYINNIFQILFGLYMFLPLIFGFIFGYVVPCNILYNKKIIYYMTSFLFIAIIGVLLNYFITYPWEGFQVLIGGLEIEGQRRWGTIGIRLKRIAGFSRASFAVSSQILYLFLIIDLFILKNIKIKIVSYIIVLLSLGLTTTKSSILTFLFYLSIKFIFCFINNHLLYKTVLLKIGIIFFIIIGIFLPIFSYYYSIDLNIQSPIMILLVNSFGERMTRVWPNAINLLINQGNIILGRGIGGIGGGIQMFEKLNINPADNMYLYLFVTFGILSVIMFIILSIKLIIKKYNSNIDINFSVLLICILLSGISSPIIESGFTVFLFGFILYILIFRGEENENYANQ